MDTTTRGAPLFVVGASRSGTQVMRSSLNRHPRIALAGETHYFDDLRVRSSRDHDEPLDDGSRRQHEDYFLALADRRYDYGGTPDDAALARETLHAAATRLGGRGDDHFEAFCRLVAGQDDDIAWWGEKTPRHVFRLDEILQAYPAARIIVMVRDPRAVVASYRDWHRKTRNEHEARRTRLSYDPSIASLLWRASVAAGLRARRRHGADHVRLLRYEDLVGAPERTLRDITDWLAEDFDPAMLDVPVQNSTVQTYTSGAGLDAEPVRRWRERLSRGEVALIEYWCRRPMRRFGYEPDARRLGPRAWAGAVGQLALAVPRAAYVNRHRMGRVASFVWSRLRLLLGPPGRG